MKLQLIPLVCIPVMRGLVPRIHVFRDAAKVWMAGTCPIGANLTRTIMLSVVIVRVGGRSEGRIWPGLCLTRPRWDYWMPRLKRGMTTER